MRSGMTLTVRLTVLYTLVSAAVLLGLGALVAWATSRHFVELDRDYLQDKVHLIQKIVGETPATSALSAKLDELLGSHHGLLIEISRDGQRLYGVPGVSFPPSLVMNSSINEPLDWTDGHRQLRGMSVELSTTIASAEPENAPGRIRLMIALDTLHHTHFMQALRQQLGLYVLLATVFSGVLGWWAARSGLAPLRIMRERANGVTAHKLDQRMPVEAVPVEMADLAESLNTMLERLQNDFAKLMDFSGDLAHELRTPISNLLTETQVTLAHKRDADGYRDILASNAEELQRLGRMVSDMLFLAKTDHGIELPHRERISLEDEVVSLFDFYDAVADEKGIRLNLTGNGEIAGDRLMVRRAISNLLSNALRHSPADAEVRVTIADQAAGIALSVSNAGEPIAASDLPRLFDRFFRVDKSRAHPDSEGAGLGLSITKAIVVAHGGNVSVVSAEGRNRFSLCFPRQPLAPNAVCHLE